MSSSCPSGWQYFSRRPKPSFSRLTTYVLTVIPSMARDLRSTTTQLSGGSPFPIREFADTFNPSLSFYWVDATDQSRGGFSSADDIMAQVTRGFSGEQLNAVHKLSSVGDLAESCPQNFNGKSECWAALSFEAIPPANNSQFLPVNYTIHADVGLQHVDNAHHDSDYEIRIMPLQWAVDTVSLLPWRIIFSDVLNHVGRPLSLLKRANQLLPRLWNGGTLFSVNLRIKRMKTIAGVRRLHHLAPRMKLTPIGSLPFINSYSLEHCVVSFGHFHFVVLLTSVSVV